MPIACGRLTVGALDAETPPPGDAGVVDSSTTVDAEDLAVPDARGPLPAWETLIDPTRLHDLRIKVAVADVPLLETNHGDDVACEVRFDDRVIKSATVHQKGSLYNGCRCIALPCRNPTCETRYSDKIKPGLHLKLDKAETLFGLRELILNNAHQDLNFLSSHIIYEIYRRVARAAHLRLPAPHTAFGRVVINGQVQGLYIVEEAVDAQFLERSFGSAGGNLYSAAVTVGEPKPDFALDPDPARLVLKHDPDGTRSREDIEALSRTIRTTADGAFASQVAQLFDLDAFIAGWAIDAIADWRDEYSFWINNYYLYDDPRDNRLVLMVHSPDAGLGNFPWAMPPPPYPGPTIPAAFGQPIISGMDPMGCDGTNAEGFLGQKVRQIPALYARYEAAVRQIANPPIWDVVALLGRVNEVATQLAAVAGSPAFASDARLKADIEQFTARRAQAEAFITAAGNCARDAAGAVDLCNQ